MKNSSSISCMKYMSGRAATWIGSPRSQSKRALNMSKGQAMMKVRGIMRGSLKIPAAIASKSATEPKELHRMAEALMKAPLVEI